MAAHEYAFVPFLVTPFATSGFPLGEDFAVFVGAGDADDLLQAVLSTMIPILEVRIVSSVLPPEPIAATDTRGGSFQSLFEADAVQQMMSRRARRSPRGPSSSRYASS